MRRAFVRIGGGVCVWLFRTPFGVFLLCAMWVWWAPAATSSPAPAPVNGWIPEYDAHIQAEVLKAPRLLEFPAPAMHPFCPRWDSMTSDQRARFYADLFFSIAGAESRWTRTAMFKETGIVNPRTGRPALDAVTGYPIVSEGLLQLSYLDTRNYRPTDHLSCPFDWAADKSAFVEDLATSRDKKSFHSRHPDLSILDPYAQLSCGLHILNTLVARHPGKDFVYVAGRYWSTMRPGTQGSKEIVKNLESRQSACF